MSNSQYTRKSDNTPSVLAPRRSRAIAANPIPDSRQGRNYWFLVMLTVIILYAAGEVPRGFELIRWLLCAIGGIGVIVAFDQALSATNPPRDLDL